MTRLRSKKLIAATTVVPLLAAVVAACGGGGGSYGSGGAPANSNHAGGPPPGAVTVATSTGAGGTHLVSGSGRSIYLWVADKGSKSKCTGTCARNWPPVVTTRAPTAGSGTNGADLGTTMRSDGSKQVTYKGHPLYFFLGDQTPGATYGQGSNQFGARWWLVAPAGTAITSGTGSSSASSGAGNSSSTGGRHTGSSGGSSSQSGGGWG